MSRFWVMSALTLSLLGTSPWLPVSAQSQFNLNSRQLQQGTIIPVSNASATTDQYFNADTAYTLALVVAQSIYDGSGRLVIPAGTQVSGQMQPMQGGAKFVASSILVNGRSYSIRASSDLIHDEKDPRQYSTEATAEDAVIGAAAGALLGVLTGGVSTTGVLGGATAGVVVGNITAPQVVVLRPNQPINITLELPLSL